MDKGLDIWVDNMNLSESSKKPFLDAIKKHNEYVNNPDIIKPDRLMYTYEIEYKDFFIPVEECIRRDSLRSNPIGAAIIRQTWNRYRTMICTLENQRVHDRIKQPRKGLKNAVIFDLDATLSFNLSGRPYWGEGCAEGIENDVPNIPVINMLKLYQASPEYTICIVTGREATDSIKYASKEWLCKQGVNTNDIYWFFRPTGSKQKGQDYKLETINGINNTYNVELVVDDSQKIVDVLRENGYTVLQPNEGKF